MAQEELPPRDREALGKLVGAANEGLSRFLGREVVCGRPYPVD